MGKHEFDIGLCEAIKRISIRDDIAYIVMVVLNMRLLTGLHWVAEEHVQA